MIVRCSISERPAAISTTDRRTALNLLFLCGRNRLRSPTAERIFADLPGFQVASAGVSPDADEPLTPEMLEDADIVFVMEPGQQRKLQRQFGRWLRDKKVVCLNVADDYDYMQPELIALLCERVPPSVPGLAEALADRAG